MADNNTQEQQDQTVLQKMTTITNWFPNLVETQVDLISTSLTSLLTTFPTPTFPLSSTTISKHHHADDVSAIGSGDTGISDQGETQAQKVVRKVGYGILGAVYAAVVLTMVMVVSVVVGVVLVNYWVEEPVFVREKLHFDYTDVNPEAVFVFGDRKSSKHGGGGGGGGGVGVPVGHTFYVSVELLVPDSDYNRDIGVFQLKAEVVSTNGRLIARSSQPSMLQFHSYPIRLMRTFILGFPILLGISRETQTIKVQMLHYKEDNLMRTEAVKIKLMPQAGTPYLPQIYEAEILMHSKLPRVKELVYNWKWTFYVWTSLYVYAVLLMLLLCFFRTLLVFPVPKTSDRYEGREADTLVGEERPHVRVSEGREFSETLRKWQQYRRKRKAALLSMSTFADNVGSTSASSYTITKDDIGPYMEEETGDSESICMGD